MIDEKTTLRDGPFAFSDLLDATAKGGTRFVIKGGGREISYLCRACDAAFPQTDEGFRALREHEGEHGSAMVVDLSELDGRTLRIVTWASTSRRRSWSTHKTAEIWAVDDERGYVYCLSNAYQGDTVWKWRIKSGSFVARALLSAGTPLGRASQCNNCAGLDAPSAPVDAMSPNVTD